MQLQCWYPGISAEDAKNVAYWERNMLALRYADGWYEDTELCYDGWRRVLSLDAGRITFHIPDAFDVGNLPKIAPNWDGHSSAEKWRRVAAQRGVLLSDE